MGGRGAAGPIISGPAHWNGLLAFFSGGIRMAPSLLVARAAWCALAVISLRAGVSAPPPRPAGAADPQVASHAQPEPQQVVRRVCRVTAYCDRGITAAGIASGVGQCAAPGDIPLGSVVYIPELNRSLVVTDRTHKRFRHNTVDIFIPDREACLQFGRQYLECHFTIISTPPRYGTLRMDNYELVSAR
jgi:3D (Asp-Asp-Asp) domain-containing protein